MTERPPFIVFEGPEGAGKSLQIQRVSAFLNESGVPHVTTREPGGTALAEAIRTIILDRAELDLDGLTELLLFSAARHAHVEEIIRPALEAGRAVLCDRFELSTRAYQGYGRGLSQDLIAEVTASATGGLEPDLYLVLDVPPRVGRRRQGRTAPDRIEREEPAFMERVRAGYQELASTDERIEMVDASRAPADVERQIRDVLERRLPAWFDRASVP